MSSKKEYMYLDSTRYYDIHLNILILYDLFTTPSDRISNEDIIKFNDSLEVLLANNYELNKAMIKKLSEAEK